MFTVTGANQSLLARLEAARQRLERASDNEVLRALQRVEELEDRVAKAPTNDRAPRRP